MTCQVLRQFVLDTDWNAQDLAHALEAIDHLKSCDSCRQSVDSDLRLRALLGPKTPVATDPDWHAVQERFATRVRRRRSTGWNRLMAVAASILFLMTTFQLGRLVPANRSTYSVSSGPPASDSAVARMPNPLSDSEISRQVKVFDEVSGVFDQRAAWTLVGDTASDMGVVEQRPRVRRELLLMRLTMLRSGRVISNSDLAILPDQTASLDIPTPDNLFIRYRIEASGADPTSLKIGVQLSLADHDPLAAMQTALQLRPGQRLSAGKLVTTGGGYELQIAFAQAELHPLDSSNKG